MTEREIFTAALEKQSAAERAAFLDGACANDRARREHIQGLLRERENLNSFLEGPPAGIAVAASPTVDHLPTEQPGTTIGPYKLLEQIGEGGMGLVYLAEQKKPIRRIVAIKVIKPGMDTQQVVARFEAERQALALMNHPNIAKVLDAGATEAGRPYFVMELVKGTPMTEFCDQQKLDTRQRLQLFITVCQAVQHAHQKGLIHRDIKPSNVLIEIHDVVPVPKVIDFGVAKAIGQQLTERTLHTGFSQMVGTPLYMSPEQAGQSSIDIDTRSDVYSLGVVLYELLTGHTPFESEALRKVGYDEMRRMICEVDPPRPSTLISTLDAKALSTVSDLRQAEPKKLSHQMQGELDWIVMKAMDKDRSRRYETASSFVADIQRYLNGESVLACPPSIRYRLKKSAKRNWILLVTSSVVATSLLIGIGLSLWQAIQANIERERAVAAEEQSEKEAQRANNEARISTAVSAFLNDDLLAQANPENQRDPNVTLRTVIDRAAEQIESKFFDEPIVEASIRYTLAKTYEALGDFGKAKQHANRSLQLRTQHLGIDDVSTIESECLAAWIINLNGDCQASRKLLETLLIRARRVLSAAAPINITIMRYLTVVIIQGGDYTAAEVFAVQALDMSRRVLGDEHPDTLVGMTNLALVFGKQGRNDEAETLHQQTLAVKRRNLGDEHPSTLDSMSKLANIYGAQSRLDEAVKLHQQTLAIKRRKLGDEHPSTLGSMTDLAVHYGKQDRLDEAEELIQQTLDGQRRTLGDEHPSTLLNMHNLANVYGHQGRTDEAEKLILQTLEIQLRTLGEEHPDTTASMMNLALAYRVKRRYNEGEKLYKKIIEISRRTLGEEHPRTLQSKMCLATLTSNWSWRLATDAEVINRDPDKAVELARAALKLQPKAPDFWNNLGVALFRSGQWEAAVETLEKADHMIEGGDRAHRPFLAMAHMQLGHEETARKLYAEGAGWLAVESDEHQQHNQRFLTEAEQLLGLSEQDRRGLVASYYTEIPLDHTQRVVERGLWHLSLGEFDLALADCRMAIEMNPQRTEAWNAWNMSALAYYRKQNWNGADEEARLAVKLAADKPNLMMQIVPLFLLAGKNDEYSAVCDHLKEDYEKWTGKDLGFVASMCLLDPQPIGDQELLLRLVRRVVEGGPQGQTYLSRANYRIGEFEKAIEGLKSSKKIIPIQMLELAIANHFAGHHEEARTRLENAIQSLQDWEGKKNANNRMEVEVLRHEAEGLILGNNGASGAGRESLPAKVAGDAL